MKLCELLNNVCVKRVINYQDPEIDEISADSRKEMMQALFVCLCGGRDDGHSHVEEAKRKGAIALVVERETASDLPQFIVENTRIAFAIICGNFYGNPASKLSLVTIVGTNGKTSTAEILSEIFRVAGYKTATIGTLGYKVDGDRSEGMLTTPDPLELHRKLKEMVDRKVNFVFLEASAHAIHYHKLAGIKAKATVFTNITRDHLDFFESMDRYAAVKLSYFKHENTALAVVNSDDEYGRRLIRSGQIPTITYGIDNPADVFAIDITETASGLSFTINAFDRIAEICTPLFGRFNVYNIMASTATAMYFGVGLKEICSALSHMNPVPGRYEVRQIQGRKFVVDYAHTPDGLQNLLSDIKKSAIGRIFTVFGCGGNRDRGKRPMMGKIASEYSDVTIITDDNPRNEDEYAIAEEIRKGVLADAITEVIPERSEAIKRAFDLSEEGDVIVIAGKGHEKTMEKKGEKIPYSDFEILQELNR